MKFLNTLFQEDIKTSEFLLNTRLVNYIKGDNLSTHHKVHLIKLCFLPDLVTSSIKLKLIPAFISIQLFTFYRFKKVRC